MISPNTEQEIKKLAQIIADKFSPPELIPGCEVMSIANKDEYAIDNGWIEAIVGSHNQQRCRWKGEFSNVQTGDYVDVLYFKSIKLFEVLHQGGTDNILAGGAWPFPGQVKIGSILYDSLQAAINAASNGDQIIIGSGYQTILSTLTIDGLVGLTIIGASDNSTVLEFDGGIDAVSIINSAEVRFENITFGTSTDDCQSGIVVEDSLLEMRACETDFDGPLTSDIEIDNSDCYLYESQIFGVNGVSVEIITGVLVAWGSAFYTDLELASGMVAYLFNSQLIGNLSGDGQISGNYQDFYGVITYPQNPFPEAGMTPVWDDDISDWVPQNITSSLSNLKMYYHAEAADVGGYQQLKQDLPDVASTVEFVSIVAGDGKTLIEEWVSYPTSGVGATAIPAGTWQFFTWCYVQNGAGEQTDLILDVYQRTSGGVETLLFSVEHLDISTVASPSLEIATSTQPEIVTAADDRIVIKLYAQTTKTGTDCQPGFFLEGTEWASHMYLPFNSAFSTVSAGAVSYDENSNIVVLGDTVQQALDEIESELTSFTQYHMLFGDTDGTINSVIGVQIRSTLNGFLLGGDVDIYRSGANELTITDQLQMPTTGSGGGILIGDEGIWQPSAGNLRTDANVGINTNPLYALDVVGDAAISDDLYVGASIKGENTTTSLVIFSNTSATNGPYVEYRGNTFATRPGSIEWVLGNGGSPQYRWWHYDGSYSVLADLYYTGQLQLPITGSSAGLLIGSDFPIYRSASGEGTLDGDVVISGDLDVDGGQLYVGQIGSATGTVQIYSSGGTGGNVSIQSGTVSGNIRIGEYGNGMEFRENSTAMLNMRANADGAVFSYLVDASAVGLKTREADASLSNPPTDAEIDALLGTPATYGDGAIFVVRDTNSPNRRWLVASTANQWAAVEMAVLT